jgi:hypothetical protein
MSAMLHTDRRAFFGGNVMWLDVTFCALAGVRSASLERTEIAGKFGKELRLFDSSDTKLLVDLVNWPHSDEEILRFTKLYGPLKPGAEPNREFRFTLTDWRMWQAAFRLAWEGASLKGLYNDTAGGRTWQPNKHGLSYRAPNLLEYFHLIFWCCPKERLKKCLRPDCAHPYFIARHLKQSYCSEICKEWGQARWKRKWWADHGRDWRHKRETERKRR